MSHHQILATRSTTPLLFQTTLNIGASPVAILVILPCDGTAVRTRDVMSNIIHLVTAGLASPATTSVAASSPFARHIAVLLMQSECLRMAVSEIGDYVQSFASTVQKVRDPATLAEFQLKINTLRCQLLLASLELDKLTRMQSQLTPSPASRCGVHSAHHA